MRKLIYALVIIYIFPLPTHAQFFFWGGGIGDVYYTAVDWQTFTTAVSEPALTSIQFQIRAGDSADTSHASWTPWTNISSGDDIETILGVQRTFVQWRAILQTSNWETTPKVGTVALQVQTAGITSTWYSTSTAHFKLGTHEDTGTDTDVLVLRNIGYTYLQNPNGDGWKSKRIITISASATEGIPYYYTIRMKITGTDAEEIAKKTLISGDDLRIEYEGEECDRFIKTLTSSEIEVWFRIGDDIIAGSSKDVELFYNNPSAGSPPQNPANIFEKDWWDGSSPSIVFHCDEGSGNTISCSVGTAYGELTSISWGTQELGTIGDTNMRLSGSYIDFYNRGVSTVLCPAHSGFNFTGTFTLAFIIRPDDIPTYISNAQSRIILFFKYGSARGWYIAINDGIIGITGRLTFLTGDASSWSALSSKTSLEAGKCYFIVCTQDASGKKIYINGKLDNSNNIQYIADDSLINLIISRTAEYSFDGAIGDIVFWNDTAINAEQVEAYYWHRVYRETEDEFITSVGSEISVVGYPPRGTFTSHVH